MEEKIEDEKNDKYIQYYKHIKVGEKKEYIQTHNGYVYHLNIDVLVIMKYTRYV